ncbi:hypothetical protein CHF27_008675 [Romboutsia maritimum]|uniref:LPXTG cell wall anchor domain-containing protein n=1 Tax=Romboutsia maritimum TaxID=2020948 RepID=A0A371IS58_9FIRM|nr:LPXTG cell wall anchor domain-containing protein [Romboutsia maritimum]RDY23311.1 hypothetical protein CHF27_008675 [Romboutsia maritimum]
MPKASRNFRNKYKIASAAIITSITMSAPLIANANEIQSDTVIEGTIKNDTNEPTTVIENKTTENKDAENQTIVKESTDTKSELTVKDTEKSAIELETKQKEKLEESTEVKEKTETKEATKTTQKSETTEEVDTNTEDKVKDKLNESDREQLSMAIEEMRISVNLIDDEDLTLGMNLERLDKFAEAAKQRIESIDKNLANSNEKEHIDWITETLKEVESKKLSAARLTQSIENVKTVFEPARKDILKNKQIVLDILGTIANEERLNLNTYTTESAYKMYHDLYANWNKELDESVIQLGYAIEEVREAVNCKENKDLTMKDNFDRMVAFAQAPSDRLEGLYVLEGLENYTQHMDNLKAHLGQVDETAKLASKMRESMDKVIYAFESNLSREEKIVALDALGNLVDANKFNINTWTSYTAMELYHKYYSLIEKQPEVPEVPVNPIDPIKPGGGPSSSDRDSQKSGGSSSSGGESTTDEDKNPTNQDKDTTDEDKNKTNQEKVTTDKDNKSINSVDKSSDKENKQSNIIKKSSDKKSKVLNNSNNPKTGDMSLLGFLGLGISSVAGLVINKKRK